MKYKDKHFYTATQHIKYLLEVEKVNQVEVNQVLREYWKLNNNDIMYVMAYYEKVNRNGIIWFEFRRIVSL